MDALGHDSEKSTLIYLSTLDTSAVDNANSEILAAKTIKTMDFLHE